MTCLFHVLVITWLSQHFPQILNLSFSANSSTVGLTDCTLWMVRGSPPCLFLIEWVAIQMSLWFPLGPLGGIMHHHRPIWIIPVNWWGQEDKGKVFCELISWRIDYSNFLWVTSDTLGNYTKWHREIQWKASPLPCICPTLALQGRL